MLSVLIQIPKCTPKYTVETHTVRNAFRGQRAYLAEVGREGFLSFLHGLNLAGGQGLEISLLSL